MMKKGKHEKKNWQTNLKYIVVMLSIVATTITFIALYRGRAKFLLKSEDVRVQNTNGEFHFYSSILSTQAKEYTLYDWDAEQEYFLEIDLENFIDSIRSTNRDINYTVTVETENSDKINIAIDPEGETLQEVSGQEGQPATVKKKSGVLQTSEKTERFNIAITKKAGVIINNGDFITITVNVQSTSPYTKSLSASFKIYKNNAQKYSMSYTEDAERRTGKLTIETFNVTEPVTFKFYPSKLILNTTSGVLQGADISTADEVTTVTIELEQNKIYNIDFIKIDDTKANVW